MKYVFLIYQAPGYDPKALSADEHKAVAEQYAALNAMPGVRPGLALGLAKDAITVRSGPNGVARGFGQYTGQSGATVGGYYEVEAGSDEEAIEIASQIPAVLQGGAVEIRPSRAYW